MLDRFKRRFSSTSKKQESTETLFNDGHVSLSRLSLSSSSRPTTVHVQADDKDWKGDAEPAPDTTEPIALTVSQPTPRPDNSASRLFSLPTELLLQLQFYLSPCSEVSLRQSCSRFFHIYTCPSFYLAGNSRFLFLCHLEHDSSGPTRNRLRLVCGHCRDLHARSAFPSSELKKSAHQRDCRQVWLCSHHGLGFEKAGRRIRAVETLFRVENLDPCTKCQPLIRNRAVADRPGKSAYTPASGVNLSDSSATGETLLITKIGISQKPSPSDARGTGTRLNAEIFPTKELAATLTGLDFRICPHIELGNPQVLSQFCRACLNLRIPRPGERGPPCISSKNGGERVGKCRASCFVKGCKTSFMFQTRESLLPDISGKRQIWLILAIYRWLGPLTVEKTEVDGPADARGAEAGAEVLKSHGGKHWEDHTVDAAEMKEMRVAWSHWMRTYGRKCMPDWSICQLHPEDCNLR